MRTKYLKFAVLLFLSGATGYFWAVDRTNPELAAVGHHDVAAEIASLPPTAPLSLITEPVDGTVAVRTAIQQAQKSVDLVIYELTDADVESDLVAAETRGVHVRVLLNHKGPFAAVPNQPAFTMLQNSGVPVAWAPAYFTFTHQKTLIVDGTTAIIMTFNLTPRYYASSRDFGLVDTNLRDVAAIEQVFNSDWSGNKSDVSDGQDLVWSPGSADALLDLINNAKTSVDIYNEEMADPRITSMLESAAARGVAVRVVMTYATNWKPVFNELIAAGVGLKTFASTGKLYIHAKMVMADDHTVFIGSENFSQTSLDGNRELGILITRPDIVSSLLTTFNDDYARARVYTTKN